MQYLQFAKSSVFILGLSLMTLGANELSVLAQTRQPTNAEIKRLHQQFEQIIRRSTKKNTQEANYTKDNRTSQEKQKREYFVRNWSKNEPELSSFFGWWSGFENNRHIYPSNVKGRVCVVSTFERDGSFDTGILSNGLIKTNSGELLLKKGNYLGAVSFNNSKFVVSNNTPFNSPRPLNSLNELLNSIIEPSQKNQIAQQFKTAGCTNYIPRIKSKSKLHKSI
jgi:hypothetical protein